MHRGLIVPWAFNRSFEFWAPTPEESLPGRCIDTDKTTGARRPNNFGGVENNYANMIFLHGQRSCIGQGFAKAGLTALIAVFVGHFRIELADPDAEV